MKLTEGLLRATRSGRALFLLVVALPTIIAGLYYGIVASDVYLSESRFVVRSPTRQSQAGFLGALLQGNGFARSQDDTYSVHDFMLSRDALRELDEKLGVRKAYASASIDAFNRFPGLDWDDSFENFLRYYRKRITVDYDPVTSITVLTVRAYRAEDAQRINDLLLRMGERLVNNLNDRSRKDLILFAQNELEIAESKAREASLALSAFRNRLSVFEPDRQASMQLQGVAKLHEELIATESQLAQIRRLSPSNPQISVLAGRAESLRRSIDAETSKVTGTGSSLSARAPQFERLALDKGFAEKQLATALASLETARSEAQRKQLYLERLVQPSTPDHPMEPRRIRGVLTVLLLGLVAWGLLSLLVASIREHVE